MLQSVVGLSSHDGNIPQTISYDPFGNTMTNIGVGSNNSLYYTGREQDPDSGLYYYRARYYDPTMGRFLTEDPKGFNAGVNFYVYAKNNPINFNDPYGLVNWDRVFWGGMEAAGGAVGVGIAATGEVASVGTGTIAVATIAGVSAPAFCHGVTEIIAGALETNQNPIPVTPPASAPALAALTVTGDLNVAKEADLLSGVAQFGYGLATAGGSTSTVEGIKASIDFLNQANNLTGSTSSADTSSAAGGFLIYPNKPNLNMMQAVYTK